MNCGTSRTRTGTTRPSWLALRAKLQFTAREWEILELYIRGYTAPQIAMEFELSKRTIETYIEIIRQKLFIGPRGRKDIMIWAEDNGFIRFYF